MTVHNYVRAFRNHVRKKCIVLCMYRLHELKTRKRNLYSQQLRIRGWIKQIEKGLLLGVTKESPQAVLQDALCHQLCVIYG